MSPLRPFLQILTTTWRYKNLAFRHPARVDSVSRRWARLMLRLLGVKLSVVGKPFPGPIVLVGNHISYVDIPILMSLTPVSWLAKKELASWPLFGSAMRSAGVLFVDRSSKQARAKVGDQMAAALQQTGRPMGIFPSGTTTVDESVAWRYGIFVTAKKHGLPIQPFRLSYRPLRQAAFIGQDSFLPHLWRLLKHPVEARIEFLEPRAVKDPRADCSELWHWACQVLH